MGAVDQYSDLACICESLIIVAEESINAFVVTIFHKLAKTHKLTYHYGI